MAVSALAGVGITAEAVTSGHGANTRLASLPVKPGPRQAAPNTTASPPGAVLSWGMNLAGPSCSDPSGLNTKPVLVSGLSGGVVAIASGFFHHLALKVDGSVWAWGANGMGELGNGSNWDSYTPVAVTGLSSGVTAIAGGASHSLALKSDGSLMAWGWNAYGELGNGSTVDANTPVPVSGLTGVAAIAAGYYHSLALKTDGSVWAWGDNSHGELGVGTWTGSTVPVPVRALGNNVIAISGGAFYSMALKADGSVWAWGYNVAGELGDGTMTDRNLPVPVVGLTTGVTAISGTNSASLALKSDGSVWAWGDNSGGQLGNGTNTGSLVPIAISGLSSDVTAIAAGYWFSLALKSDGSMEAWGANFCGQLGNGTTTNTNVPAPVSGLSSGVAAIAAGAFESTAIVLPPGAPTSVTAKPAGKPGEVALSWQAPATGSRPIGYGVRIVNQQDGSSTFQTFASAATTQTITQLNNCTNYEFDVYSLNPAGSSGFAPAVFATPYLAPPTPTRDGSPAYVVILVSGTATQNPAGDPLPSAPDYQPLAIGPAGFCFGADAVNGLPPPGEAAVPPQLKAITGTWADDPLLQRFPHTPLSDQLAAEGAVILPFSYNGAGLVPGRTARDATFHFIPFSKQDVAFADPEAEASVLDSEIHSINVAWPRSRIVLVGHSLGGLIAELWWLNDRANTTQVAGVFSLDAPIRGVQDALACTGLIAPALAAFCSFMAGVGPVEAQYYFTAWVDGDLIDQLVLAADTNGEYIPVGTFGDNLYAAGDFPLDGTFSQLVFQPGCHTPCNPTGFDFGSQDNTFPNAGDSCYGQPSDILASHSFVKNCPNVVNYIGCLLIGQTAGCTLPTASPNSLAPSLRLAMSRPNLTSRLATSNLPNQIPPASGQLSPTVVSPGETATIDGAGLGATPGLVQFMSATSGLINAPTSSWTDSQITLTVPSGVTTGPVFVVTSGGFPLLVGRVTVLGASNGVAAVSASLVGPAAPNGETMTVSIQAIDGNGQPVPSATVGLSNGVGVLSAQTDATGQAALQIAGFGSRTLVAFSGSASTSFNVTWTTPPSMSLRLTASTVSPPPGVPIVVSATLLDAAGHPVASQPINFHVVGPSSIGLSNPQVLTDSSGVATTTVTSTGNGPFVVDATADDSAVRANIVIRYGQFGGPSAPVVPPAPAAGRSTQAPPVPPGPAGAHGGSTSPAASAFPAAASLDVVWLAIRRLIQLVAGALHL